MDRPCPRRRLPFALLVGACVVAPALLQGQASCNTGETRLAELAMLIQGAEQLAFDAEVRNYDAWLSDAPPSALVRAFPLDPDALVYVNVQNEAGHTNVMAATVGGGEVTTPLAPGRNLVRVYVKAPGGASDFYDIDVVVCEATCPKARTWGEAELLETYDVDDAYQPQVAWTPDGGALAIWGQASSSGDEIWSSRYTPAVAWTAPERIDRTYARGKTWPQLVVDDAGNAVAIWSQGETRHWGIWASRYTPDGGWGEEVRIDELDTLNFKTPTAVGDAEGNFMVVWSEQNEALGYDVFANRYTRDIGWGTPEEIDPLNQSTASFPRVAMNRGGAAIAVWEQGGVRNDVYVNRYSPTAGWGAPEPVENDYINSAFDVDVAIDETGNAVVVWQRAQEPFYGDDRDIWSNRYAVGSGWGTAERIDDSERRYSTEPRVAIDSDGRSLACWHQTNDGFFSIWCNWHSGAAWGTPKLIEDDTVGNGYFPQPAFDGDGSALVVWERWDEVLFDVWANRYTRDGGWETAGPIEHDDRGDARRPRLALSREGNAIVVWSQSDGTMSSVWRNHFE